MLERVFRRFDVVIETWVDQQTIYLKDRLEILQENGHWSGNFFGSGESLGNGTVLLGMFPRLPSYDNIYPFLKQNGVRYINILSRGNRF